MENYRNIVFLPTKLINSANDEGWLRSLGYLVKMKALYKNNTVYNFSLRKLAEKIKCSPACLSHHLKQLEKKCLIKYHSGNITFTGLKKLLVITASRNTTAVQVDRKDQFYLLRSLMIKSNLQRQAYKMRKHGIKLRKRNSQSVPNNYNESASSYIGLSCKGIGNLFGLSKESGSRIRKKLETLGVLKCTPIFSTLFSGISHKAYAELKVNFQIPAYSFYRRGSIVVQRRMEIEYVSYC